MTTLAAYCNSCPEAVSDVNITSATLEIDGQEVQFKSEYFEPADVDTEGTTSYLSLTRYPVSDEGVTVFRNGTILRPTTDYTINGNLVILTFAPNAEDSFLVNYMGYESDTDAESTLQDIPVGTLVPYNGSSVPPGWCLADGTTEYAKATFLALYSFCSTNSLVVPGSDSGSNFIVKELKSVLNSGGVLVELPAIIKA